MKMILVLLVSVVTIIIVYFCSIRMPSFKGTITNHTGEDISLFYWDYSWSCQAETGLFYAGAGYKICGHTTGKANVSNQGQYTIPGAFFMTSPLYLRRDINGSANLYRKGVSNPITSFDGSLADEKLLDNFDLFKSELTVSWDSETLSDIRELFYENQIVLNEKSKLALKYVFLVEIDGIEIHINAGRIPNLMKVLQDNHFQLSEYLVLPSGYNKPIEIDVMMELVIKHKPKKTVFEKTYRISKEAYTRKKRQLHIDKRLIPDLSTQVRNHIGVDRFGNALRKKDRQLIDELLSNGSTGLPERTYLDMAIDDRNYEITKLLISKNFPISCSPKKGKTSIQRLLGDFYLAYDEWENQSNLKSRPVLEDLLATIPLTKECINFKSPNKEAIPWHPLRQAIHLRLWGIVERLLNHESDPNFLVDVAVSGNIKAYDLLLEYGADFSRASEESLNIALIHRHLELAEYLLKKGAKTSEKTLVSAVESGMYQAVDLIVNRYPTLSEKELEKLADPEILKIAVTHKADQELVQYLLDTGTPVPDGLTSTAIIFGNLDAIRVLLQNDPSQPDDHFIYHAVGKGKLENISYLIDKGFDINKVHYGITPLLKAASNGRVDVVNLLLANGAEMTSSKHSLLNEIVSNARSEKKHRNDKQKLFSRSEIIDSLQFAQQKGAQVAWDSYFFKNKRYLHRALIVLESIDDLQNEAKKEWSPILHRAAQEGNKAMIKAFLEKGVHLDDPIQGELTLKQVLENNHHHELIQDMQ